MAEKNDAKRASLPTENDVQYLSDGYDALVQSKTNMVEDLKIYPCDWIYRRRMSQESTKPSTKCCSTVTNII